MTTRRSFISTISTGIALLFSKSTFANKKNLPAVEVKNIPLSRLYKTSPFELTQERLDVFKTLQAQADLCSNTMFDKYRMDRFADPDTRPTHLSPIINTVEDALDKIFAEIKALPLPTDFARIWLVYNMCYIIQTPTALFGIDISSPSDSRIAKKLDFILITHNHVDHYSTHIIRQMGEKPVVSNFIDNKYKQGDTEQIIKFGNI